MVHRFLEVKGMTKTVREQRDELRAIDLDSNNKVAFIEFLLFTYKKTPAQMFSAKPSDHLIAKLEEAIRQYKAVFEEKKKKVRWVGALGMKTTSHIFVLCVCVSISLPHSIFFVHLLFPWSIIRRR